VKELLHIKNPEDAFFRPLGAGLALLIPLILAMTLNNMQIAAFAALGAFAYLAFQRKSISYNLKAIFLHGFVLAWALNLGILTGRIPWIIPFAIAFFSFVAYLVCEIFRIPKPKHFFVIMVYATGTNINIHQADTMKIFIAYLGIGVLSSLLIGLLVSCFEGLPWKIEKTKFEKLKVINKYYVSIYQKPEIFLNAFHFSMILFVAGYVSYLLRDTYGYWVLISTAAVLSGEEIQHIQRRYVGRILGSIVGLLIGAMLVNTEPSLVLTIALLTVLNICIEYFMPRNYAIANFFTNPLVLLLGRLTTGTFTMNMITYRLTGVVLGSVIAFVLVAIMHYALRINKLEI
jgi:uncharacterized membrane protein YccC